MEQRHLARLKREWLLLLLASLLFLAAGYLALAEAWNSLLRLSWLAASGAVLAYHFATLWVYLPENRPKNLVGGPLFASLGAANRITIIRAMLVAALVGFLFHPRPEGWSAWVPGVLFLLNALLDVADGFIARITRRTTILGERLDMQWDSWGVLVASILVVSSRQAPLPYLLIGLARYLYLFGLWVHRKRGFVVSALPPSRFRRVMAGMQMGFLSVILMPVFSLPVTQVAAIFFMIPSLVGFIRDYLVVTGHTIHLEQASRVRWLSTWLPLGLRTGLVALLAGMLVPWFQGVPLAPGSWLVAILAIPALLLGLTGRLVALALLVMSSLELEAFPLDWRYWSLLVFSILLFMTGTGRFSLWKPEDWLIDHRLGEVKP